MDVVSLTSLTPDEFLKLKMGGVTQLITVHHSYVIEMDKAGC